MSAGKEEYNWPGTRILIAEDDDFSFQFFEVIFRERGVDLMRAKNGEDAIRLFNEHNDINLILMDIQLPVVDGYAVTRKIREVDPDIPIIAQTAFAQDGNETKCLEAGCTAYISKPIDMKKLLAMANKYLG
ncbi:response regulator [Bacteroidota bacterium]